MSNWLEKNLGDWGAYAARHRGRVLLMSFAVTLLSLPLAWRAVSNLDVNLFNQASVSLKRFRMVRELSEDFGGDILAAVASVPEKPTPEQTTELKAFGTLLTAELSHVGANPEDQATLNEQLVKELPPGKPWLRQVECRTGQGIEQALRKIVKDRPYVVLTPQNVEELKALFTPEALAAKMESVATTLPDLAPNSAERVKLQEDPLGLSELATQALKRRLDSQRTPLSTKDGDGYFVSKDGTTLVVTARAALPHTRLDFNRALMAAVQRAENRAILAFRGTKPSLTTALKSDVYAELAEPAGTLQVGFTGIAAVSVENERSLRYDLIGNTMTAFIGVLALFLIVFRLIMLAWDVTWTTAIVIVWTLAVAGAVKGSISVLGGAFTCILLGTGTDYAIHLHNAYHGFRHVQALPVEEALRQTMIRCGPGIVTASLTTCLAFFGLAFTSFAGLAEFGLLAGVSVVLGCVMMVIVFPALLCRPEKGTAKQPEALGMGLPQLGRWLEKPGALRACLVFGVLAVVAGALFIKYGADPGPETVAGVKFDADMGNLRSVNIKAIPLRTRLTEKFGFGLADVRVVVEAPTEDLAFAGSEEVARRMQPFIDSGEISPGGNVLDFVPSARQQQLSLEALKGFDAQAASDAFRKAATERFGEKGIVFFKPFLKRLHDFGLLTREPSPLTLANVMQGPLSNLLSPFVKLDTSEGKDRVRLVSSWFPQNLHKPAAWYNKVADALETQPPQGVQIRLTAARMVGFEMKESLLHDCGWISLLVSVSVAIALGVAFRSLYTSLLAIIPLLYAFLALLAGVTLCTRMGWDFSLNFVNLIMFPLLLGSGIDVGIYMVCEAVSPRRPPIGELMADTGRSVLCCTLTTLVGYGSFFWSSYTGLISLGIAAIFGYTGALFGALIVLPALLGVLRSRERKKSAAHITAPIVPMLTEEQAK